jgi:hypothetical protein
MDYIAELFAGEVEQLIEINATVCKLSEGSLLLDLCSSHSSVLLSFWKLFPGASPWLISSTLNATMREVVGSKAITWAR